MKQFEFDPNKVENDIVPEYVEYVETKYKGQICKVFEWTPHNYCKLTHITDGILQPFKHLVKPSTKEAFDNQNNPKTLTKEELIEQAYKRGYVKGVTVKSLYCPQSNNYTGKIIDSSICQTRNNSNTELWFSIDNKTNALIYEKGNWAEIIETPDFTFSHKSQLGVPMSKLTSLPERWHIKVTEENQVILTRWKDTHSLIPIGFVAGMVYNNYSKKISKEYNPTPKCDGFDFGIEITFDEFEKWVLNKHSFESKMIDISKPKFKVGDFIQCDGLTNKYSYEIAKIEGDEFWIYYHPGKFEDNQKYKFSKWLDLKVVDNPNLIKDKPGINNTDFKVTVNKSWYQEACDEYIRTWSDTYENLSKQYPLTPKDCIKSLEFQQPVIIKSKKSKFKLIIINQ